MPRIRELLHRIGFKKAKFFAVMDLTSGYHQAPLDPESIPYTAFVTSRGVFEWVRVPIGLKGTFVFSKGVIYNRVARSLGIRGGIIPRLCHRIRFNRRGILGKSKKDLPTVPRI